MHFISIRTRGGFSARARGWGILALVALMLLPGALAALVGWRW